MISYIMVSFNTVNLIVQSIESIIKTCKNYEVIVVDNNSHDQSGRIIRQKYEGNLAVKVIQNNENLGFSVANNIGANEAKGDYIVFVNPDTLFIEDVGSKLFEIHKTFFKNKDVILSPLILNPDYTKQHCMNLYPIINFATVFKKIVKIVDRRNIRKSDWITGVSLSMTKETYKKLSGWNEDYDLYSEDLDICYRLDKDLHGKSYVVMDVRLIHYGNQSGKQVYTKKYALAKKKIMSLQKFYQVHFSESRFRFYLCFMAMIFGNKDMKRYLHEEYNAEKNKKNGLK